MFSFLSYWLYESCDRFPVQVALWTLGQLVASTGYVVEPYRKYPTLLEVLLNFLKTEQNQGTRREVGSLSDLVFTDLLGEWREREMFAALTCSSGVDETSCPFPFCPCSWEWERSVRERCFVVVRCCDECFPFLLPLSHAGYPCVGASRGTGSLQAQSEHWHDRPVPGCFCRQPVRVQVKSRFL